ncbi:MAG: hypothetical protein IT204_12665 [Fimbriimonadaceae bacterium]|nr:hypothetical protein [Fimbriimonadaceae bacterium]
MRRIDWRWRLALRCLLCAIGCAGCAALGSLTLVARTYRTEATLLFPLPAASANASGVFGLIAKSGFEVPTGAAYPLNTYQALLRSQPVLLAVGQKTRYQKVYKALPDPDLVRTMGRVVDVKIDVDRTIHVGATLSGTPRVQALGDFLSGDAAKRRDAPYRALTRQIVLQTVAEMRQIADRLAVDSDKAAFESAKEAYEEAVDKDRQLRLKLLQLQRQSGLIEPGMYASEATRSLLSQRQTVAALDAEIRGVQQELSAVQRFVSQAGRQATKLPEDVPFLVQLRVEHRQAAARLTWAQERYGPESPEVLEAKSVADRLRRELDATVKLTAQGYQPTVLDLNRNLAGLQAKRRQTKLLADQAERQIRRLPPLLATMSQVQGQIDALRQQLPALKDAMERVRARYETSGLRWSVLNEPYEPTRKSSPSTLGALLLGGVVGLALGLLSGAGRIYGALLTLGATPAAAAEE